MLLLIDNVIYSYLTTATFLFLTFLIEFLIYVRFHLRLPSNRQENYRQDVVEQFRQTSGTLVRNTYYLEDLRH